MNILIDDLPQSVEINRQEYEVNWGFRTFILIEICIFDPKLSDIARVSNALNLFYPDIPDDYDEAFEKMMWFYRGGMEEDKSGSGSGKPRRAYCFEQDSAYIYSAFRTQYGIDLQDIKSTDLHWWKFKAMFESLDDELKISKIMGYRLINTTGMDKAQKKFYAEMKKLYALDVDSSVDSRVALAKRNSNMQKYVIRRLKEVNGEKEG